MCTSARSAVRFSFSSSAMIFSRNVTVPTSAILPIASSTGLRSDFSAYSGRMAGSAARSPISPERFDEVELEPEIVALIEHGDQMRQRGRIAVLAERRDDRRGDVDVLLAMQEVDQDLKGLAAAQVAEQVDEREAHVDIALAGEPRHDRLDRRRADADQRLRGRVALAGVLVIGERVDQAVNDVVARLAHQAVDDRLAHAPVAVAEKLEHQRQVALRRRRDGVRRFLPRIGIRRASLIE